MQSLGSRLLRRACTGITVVETTLATSLLAGALVIALPVLKQTGDSGDEGSARITSQIHNMQALTRLGTELQNTSTTALDPSGSFRFEILDGAAPTPLEDARTGDLGGFRGVLGGSQDTSATAADGTLSVVTGSVGAGGTVAGVGRGSGARGGSRIGRVRSESLVGAVPTGSPAMRPRRTDIPLNSIVRFQKVEGYAVNAVSGGLDVDWSSTIEYRVSPGNELVRIQDGVTETVAPSVVGFRAELTDAGTLMLTVVTQRRVARTAAVTFHANRLEVLPKN